MCFAVGVQAICLKERGLAGVELVVFDDHAGLKKAIREVLPEAAWQRSYVHFLRNAWHSPCPARRTTTASKELRWPVRPQRRARSAAGLELPGPRHGKVSTQSLPIGSGGNSEGTLTVHRLPAQAGLPRPHHQHRKSTNRLERLSEEIHRSTRVVRLFPNAESCPPWERGLPGRIEKSRHGCKRREGSPSPQRGCLTHDKLFARLDGHHRGTAHALLACLLPGSGGAHFRTASGLPARCPGRLCDGELIYHDAANGFQATNKGGRPFACVFTGLGAGGNWVAPEVAPTHPGRAETTDRFSAASVGGNQP